MATGIKQYLLLDFGLTYPITLIPHIANGHGDVKLNRRELEAYLSYHCTPDIYGIFLHILSLFMVIQKYLDRCICLAIIYPII
jgi:hypothetical protein